MQSTKCNYLKLTQASVFLFTTTADIFFYNINNKMTVSMQHPKALMQPVEITAG